jgi:hypothetical protein
MPNFDSRKTFVAAGLLSGLGLVAAGATQAAEPGGRAPNLSSNDEARGLANLWLSRMAPARPETIPLTPR